MTRHPCEVYDLDIPEYIILGLDEEIDSVKSSIKELNLSHQVIEVSLDDLVYVLIISDDDNFDEMLLHTAIMMCRGEGINDDCRLPEEEMDMIIEAIERFGKQIKRKILNLNIYIDGHFPYSFFRRLDGGSMVLRFTAVDF